MAVYIFIAAVSVLVLYYVLAKEPLPDWPINLVHLLSRH
jgi:hypothetical protein